MYLKKETGGIWKWIGYFFGAMILFTILSRAIYQHGTAVVTTATPAGGTIDHTVQIDGKTVQNQELAVTTIGGLRVGSVCVNEGQQVRQGDVLFQLDLDYLDEVILRQEQDMKKQQLSVWESYAQNSNAQKQRENQQAQAEENYDNAVSQAQTAVDRARRNLDRAKTALEDYRNGVTDEKAEEEALKLACQEARTDCSNAVAALEALEQEIDQAVQDAISQAERELQRGTGLRRLYGGAAPGLRRRIHHRRIRTPANPAGCGKSGTVSPGCGHHVPEFSRSKADTQSGKTLPKRQRLLREAGGRHLSGLQPDGSLSHAGKGRGRRYVNYQKFL